MEKQVKYLLDVPQGPLKIFASSTREDDSNVRLSLVLPTYNECKNIPAIVQQLTNLLDEVIPMNYELIVVDDNSPDKTWEIAQSIMPQYPQLRVMRRIDERGLSTAVIRGWQAAKGEIFGVIDADLQHPPAVLLQMLAAMKKEEVDMVVASRHVEGGGVSDWSFIRRFLSRGAQTLGLIILPGVVGRVSDPMSGYFMIRRKALVGKTMHPLGYKILIETLGRGNIRKVAEVGYVFHERLEGESKVTWQQYVDYLRHLIRLRLDLWRVGRFLRFGIVGFSGVFVDMAVLYLLSDPTTLAWGLTRSKIISAEVAIVNNFLWNDAWTFADMSSKQNGWTKRLKRFLKFNLVCLGGVTLNVLLLNVMFNFLGFDSLPAGRYIANFIAIAVVTVWNFWLNLKLSWRVTEVDK